MIKRYYSVGGHWWDDNEIPAVISARFLDTLDRLAPLAPAMNNWLLADPITSKAIPLANARPKMTALAEKGVGRTNGAADPREGYRLFARGGEVQSEFGTSRSVDVEADVGSKWTNHVSFAVGSLSRPPDPAPVTYSIYKQALQILASIWPCPWLEASLYVSDFQPVVAATSLGHTIHPPPRPREEYHFPWILYLSAPLVAGLRPPAELDCEQTPGGGLILSATQERLDVDNPEHKRRAQMLQAIMADRVDVHKDAYGVLVGGYPPRIGPY